MMIMKRRQFLTRLSAPIIAMPMLSAWQKTSDAAPADGKVLRVALMGLGGYAQRVAEVRLTKREVMTYKAPEPSSTNNMASDQAETRGYPS